VKRETASAFKPRTIGQLMDSYLASCPSHSTLKKAAHTRQEKLSCHCGRPPQLERRNQSVGESAAFFRNFGCTLGRNFAYLSFVEIQNARRIFPKIRQRGDGWCIPACYEAILQHTGVGSPTQEEIVTEYDRRFGSGGYVHMTKRELHCITNPSADDLRPYGFPKGDFNSFTEIANHLLPNGADKIFVHPADRDAKFEEYLNQSVATGLGAIIVVCPPNVDCHALLLVGFDGGVVDVYDPQHGGFHQFPVPQFNRDCVVLQIR